MIHDPFTKARVGADAVREGCFLFRRDHENRVPLPVRIWFGPPLCPETGEPLDRSPRWQISIAGQMLDEEPVRVGHRLVSDISDVWPRCARWPISSDEYSYRIERALWAGEHDANDPYGDTLAVIDPMTVTLPPMEELFQ